MNKAKYISLILFYTFAIFSAENSTFSPISPDTSVRETPSERTEEYLPTPASLQTEPSFSTSEQTKKPLTMDERKAYAAESMYQKKVQEYYAKLYKLSVEQKTNHPKIPRSLKFPSRTVTESTDDLSAANPDFYKKIYDLAKKQKTNRPDLSSLRSPSRTAEEPYKSKFKKALESFRNAMKRMAAKIKGSLAEEGELMDETFQ